MASQTAQRFIQPASATVSAAGTATFTWGPPPPGMTATGQVQVITNQTNYAQPPLWVAYLGPAGGTALGVPVTAAQGGSPMSLQQCSGETLVVQATGLSNFVGTIFTATWAGVADTNEATDLTPPQGPPQITSATTSQPTLNTTSSPSDLYLWIYFGQTTQNEQITGFSVTGSFASGASSAEVLSAYLLTSTTGAISAIVTGAPPTFATSSTSPTGAAGVKVIGQVSQSCSATPAVTALSTMTATGLAQNIASGTQVGIGFELNGSAVAGTFNIQASYTQTP